MTPYPATTALILAGGAGRRMGGQDKGLMPYREGRLIEPVIRTLERQVDEVLINANRHLDEYRQWGHRVVSDPFHPHQPYAGPAAALMHASRHARHDWLLLAPCDMPDYQAHWPAALWQVQQQSRAAVVIAHDGQRLQPTVALIHRPCLPQRPAAAKDRLLSVLTAGRYSVCLLGDDAWAFANLNTPEQLSEAVSPS
ncbi:molybdenum cofactor guanylyltransferase [Halothiobacillus sp. DCM-1]|uniref:molybdenum cofactor guanylyltransferase n=1 Tax=Halothiobacillus sp. DCM-1 TaxID=3112558 RepID=UPI00324C7C6C